jgi:hypothetical protein
MTHTTTTPLLPPLIEASPAAPPRVLGHYPDPPAPDAPPVDPWACEALLADWFGCPVVLLGSGRAGLHLYLRAKGCNRYRDRVRVPPYMSLCVLDTLARGAAPSEDGDGHAVSLLYHQYGLSQSARPPAPVIEDICHQFFAEPGTGKRPWAGEAAVFSLPKFFSLAGMGGGIVTGDEDLAARIRALRDAAEAELPGARDWMRQVIGATYRDPAASPVAPLLEAAYALLTRYPRPDGADLAGFPATANTIAAVGAKRRRVVKRLIGALGPGAAPPDILGGLIHRLPFAFPYFGCGERERLEALDKDLAAAGIDAGVYNLDLARDMNGPRYRPCILLPCHQDVSDGQIETMARILGVDRA